MQKKCFNNPLENNDIPSDRSVKIDLSALAGNYASIKKIVNKKDVIAYVKADAYGHGLLKVVATLIDKGVSMFAVASLNELLEIRTLFSDIRVLVGSSYYSEDSLNLIRRVKKSNRKAKVIVTATEINTALRFYNAGADYVVMPHFLGGEHVSHLIRDVRKRKRKLKEEKKMHIQHLQERKEVGHEHPKDH